MRLPLPHRRDLVLSIALFLGLLVLYAAGRMAQLTDSTYTFLQAEQLVFHGSWTLDSYFEPPLDPEHHFLPPIDGIPYPVRRQGGRIVHFYPPGGVLLSTPFALAGRLAGWSAGREGAFDLRGERRLQRITAGLVAALTAVVLFALARLYLDRLPALALALAAGTGSQLLSTASRALWTDTWGVLVLSAILFGLARARCFGKAPPVLLLASLTAWLFAIKPSYAPAILALTLLVAIEHRGKLLAWCATGAAWALGFALLARQVYGSFLPGYYHGTELMEAGSALDILAIQLFSPSRGLFIYVPTAALALWLVLRHWRRLPDRPLAATALAAIGLYLAMLAAWPDPGGFSYGPRLTTALLPWFALLGALGWRGALEAEAGEDRPRARLVRRVGFALLLGWSVFANLPGAYSLPAWDWNAHPRHINEARERLWQWHDAQFLRGWREGLYTEAPVEQ